ncbi:MAG: hypothetical protein EBR82_39430 [Caulobacteraceae bacterium]|nr:hypothetical protein [Caulobacteraceae bacterium]
MKAYTNRGEHWKDCDSIYAKINNSWEPVSYGLVDGARLIPSRRDDGYERIVLNDGRTALVQSIDIDSIDETLACEASTGARP